MTAAMAFRISIADTDVSFSGTSSQSILEAAARAGIELPHACNAGLCGSCAGTIEHGTVGSARGSDLTNELCEPGQVLFCGCGPKSDLCIRPRSWRRSSSTGRKVVAGKVFRNTAVTGDVSILQLRLPAGQRVKFKAGQHLRIELPENEGRFYSMANAPQESDAVTLHVRQVPDGLFSSRVRSLMPGDVLRLELPLGDFCVPDEEERPLVFVATGTGFAPIKSIIDDFARRGLRRRMALLWGGRCREDLYLLDAVSAWQHRWPDFRFVPALSRPAGEALPGMFAGRVDAALREVFPSLEGHALYCCGSAGMVQTVLHEALRLRLTRTDFHADAFVPSHGASL